jgi:hypothetical protein
VNNQTLPLQDFQNPLSIPALHIFLTKVPCLAAKSIPSPVIGSKKPAASPISKIFPFATPSVSGTTDLLPPAHPEHLRFLSDPGSSGNSFNIEQNNFLPPCSGL